MDRRPQLQSSLQVNVAKQRKSSDVDLDVEIMVFRGDYFGYCAICCRPTNRGHFMGRCFRNGKWPSFEEISLDCEYGLKYSSQMTGWEVVQPSKEYFSCTIPYRWDGLHEDASFTICQDCMLILPRFFRSRADKGHYRGKNGIHNPYILHQHLKYQFMDGGYDQRSEFRLHWQHNGFVDKTVKWEHNPRTRRWGTSLEYKWIESEASKPIASLSTWILSNLEPLTNTSMQRVSFLTTKQSTVSRRQQSGGVYNLPAEVIMIISSHLDLSSVFNMREACYYFSQSIELNQWFWYTRFIRYELFRFMFTYESQDVIADIKAKAIKRRLLPNRMDWMKLIKQMSVFSSFANGGCLSTAPAPFRNLRRIWKILETIERETPRCP